MNKAKASKYLAALGLSAAASLAGGYLIIPWEGSVKDRQGYYISYLDAVGVPTMCFGETQKGLYGEPIKLGMKYTEEECIALLAKSIPKYEKDVEDLVKVEFKSPYQKASLISFTYNVGKGNVASSSLLKELNRGNHEYACNKLVDWVYAKKKKLNGLVSRRAEELSWCLGEVDYEIKTTYNEIIGLVRDTSESHFVPDEASKEEEKQITNYSVSYCKPYDSNILSWIKCAWNSKHIPNV